MPVIRPEEEQRRIEAITNAKTLKEAAINLGVSLKDLRYFAKSRGFEVIKRCDHDKRLELYNQGLSDAEIGEIVGAAASTIYTWRFKRKLKNNHPKPNVSNNKETGVPANKVLDERGQALCYKFFSFVLTIKRDHPGDQFDIAKTMLAWNRLAGEGRLNVR